MTTGKHRLPRSATYKHNSVTETTVACVYKGANKLHNGDREKVRQNGLACALRRFGLSAKQ